MQQTYLLNLESPFDSFPNLYLLQQFAL
jgi:hypothetical protein